MQKLVIVTKITKTKPNNNGKIWSKFGQKSQFGARSGDAGHHAGWFSVWPGLPVFLPN